MSSRSSAYGVPRMVPKFRSWRSGSCSRMAPVLARRTSAVATARARSLARMAVMPSPARRAASCSACARPRAARELESAGLDGLHEVLLVERLVRARVAVREEEVLPLPDHAVAHVVHEQHLHRDVVRRQGLELAVVHADRAVAVDVDDERARV